METRLHNLLHDIATEMPIEVEASVRPTLRRARSRRVMTSVGAGVVVVALVAVSVSALRLTADPAVPAVSGPNPQPERVQPLWPETDAEAIAAAQAAVDEGHQPLRTTADGTAMLLATNLLGWDLDDVVWRAGEPTGPSGPDASPVIELSNRRFDARVPGIAVELRQPGRAGPIGVWSVVGVSSPLIELDPISEGPTPGTLHLTGRVSAAFEGAPSLEGHVLDGATIDPALGAFKVGLENPAIEVLFRVSPTPDGRATLLVTIPDATGASLAAAMVSIETPVGEPEVTGVDVTGVSPDVAATAQRIYDAARARDFDALAALLDPNTFVYNLDDGSDPIPAWRADPGELELMVAILQMPPTTREIEGVGTFTFWPYLVNSDFSALGDRERADLAALGFTDEEIQLMIDGGRGYQGPRLAIDERGTWRNFITVGE